MAYDKAKYEALRALEVPRKIALALADDNNPVAGAQLVDTVASTNSAWSFVTQLATETNTPVDWTGAEGNTWDGSDLNLISINNSGNVVIEKSGLYQVQPNFTATASADASQDSYFSAGVTESADELFSLSLDLSGKAEGETVDAYFVYINGIGGNATRFAFPVFTNQLFPFAAGTEIFTSVGRDSGTADANVSVGLNFYPLMLEG